MRGQILIPQIYPVAQGSFTLGGSVQTIRLNRDSVVRRLWICINAVLSGGIATSSADGYKALLASIIVKATINGKPINPVNGIGSASLFELLQYRGGIQPFSPDDWSTTGLKRLYIPIDFMRKNFAGFLQYCNCIPAHTAQSFDLIFTPGLQADVDAAGSPTFAGTFNYTIMQEQYFFDSLPVISGGKIVPRIEAPNAPFAITYIESEVAEDIFISGTGYATGVNNFKLPAGGKFAHILARARASATAKQVDTTAQASSAPFSTAETSGIILYDANRQIKQQTTYLQMRASNYLGIVDSMVNGNIDFPFEWGGQNGLFDTGQIEKGESQVTIGANVVTSTGGQVSFVRDRIFDVQGLLG